YIPSGVLPARTMTWWSLTLPRNRVRQLPGANMLLNQEEAVHWPPLRSTPLFCPPMTVRLIPRKSLLPLLVIFMALLPRRPAPTGMLAAPISVPFLAAPSEPPLFTVLPGVVPLVLSYE